VITPGPKFQFTCLMHRPPHNRVVLDVESRWRKTETMQERVQRARSNKKKLRKKLSAISMRVQGGR